MAKRRKGRKRGKRKGGRRKFQTCMKKKLKGHKMTKARFRAAAKACARKQ